MRIRHSLLTLLVVAHATTCLAGAASSVPAAAWSDSARLERVSFARSSRLPGIVARLHFSRQVNSFGLTRSDSGTRVRTSIAGASIKRDFACDETPAPLSRCMVSENNGSLEIAIETVGQIVTADVYRDGSISEDLLVYIHASDLPVASHAPGSKAEGHPADGIPNRVTSSNSIPVVRASFRSDGSDQESSETVITRERSTSGATSGDPATDVEDSPPDAAGIETDEADRLRDEARLRIDTVVLDAGHGGKDPGTIGYGRIREKDVVLDVTLRVGALLKDAGINVVYTRDDDTFIELKDRGRLALEAGGKLFVSIHANSARNTSARGTETFYLGANKTSAARDVIERENKVIDLEDDRAHYDQFDAARLARLRLTQSANIKQSLELSNRMQEQYRERVGRVDRKVKEGNLLVLWSAGMPAVLTEIGFISNPEEARFLTSSRGKDYIASAIFRSIRDYIVAYEAELDLASNR